MTIEFLTDDNPLYVLPFFESFLKNYAGEFKVSQISLCRPMGKRSRVQLLKRLTALYGMLGIVRLSARIIRARLCGLLPLGTGAARFHTLAQLCRAYGVRCEKVADPNDNAFLDGMAARQSDLLVSVACPYILKAKVLKMPCMGCINIHHSKLPKYRGMMPTFWQLFHGEKSVGITVHTMAEKIDDGRALLQEEMMVEPGECLDHLIRRSKVKGAHCMARVIRDLRDGNAVGTVLDTKQGTYFTFPEVPDIVDFRRRGLRAI